MSARKGWGCGPVHWAVGAVGLVLLFFYDTELARLIKLGPGQGRGIVQTGYWLGHGLVLFCGLTALWLLGRFTARPRWKAAGLQGLVAFGLSGGLVQLFKHLIGRPRPRLWADGVTHFGPSLADGLDSFPSGHTSTSMAVALILSWHYPAATPVFMFGAALVGAARLLGGSHFPLDVLAGIALGLACGWISLALFNRKGPPPAPVRETDH